jgi:hypothetical protein
MVGRWNWWKMAYFEGRRGKIAKKWAESLSSSIYHCISIPPIPYKKRKR